MITENNLSILNDENQLTINDESISIDNNDDGFDIEKEKRKRRSSWQTKLERRRKKGLTSIGDGSNDFTGSGNDLQIPNDGLSPGYSRQKRHSWWNIFVPDNLKQR